MMRLQATVLTIGLLGIIADLPAIAQTNSWITIAPMTFPRTSYTLTSLANGQVLATGGCTDLSCIVPTSTTEIFNPTTGLWTGTGFLSKTRNQHTATLLNDGRVLVAGGCIASAPCTGTNTAETYNPNTGNWSLTGSMITGRYAAQMTRLNNGEVLVTGGIGICNSSICNTLASVEIYNPTTGQWRTGSAMPQPRIGQTLTTLADGRVLMTGGCVSTGLPCTTLDAAIYIRQLTFGQTRVP